MDGLENGEVLRRALNAEISAMFLPNARSSYQDLCVSSSFDNTLPISNSLTGGRGFAVTTPEPSTPPSPGTGRSVSLG